MTKTESGKTVSLRSLERYKEAMDLYATTTEPINSIACRFGINSCSFAQFIKRNFPELVEKRKRQATDNVKEND